MLPCTYLTAHSAVSSGRDARMSFHRPSCGATGVGRVLLVRRRLRHLAPGARVDHHRPAPPETAGPRRGRRAQAVPAPAQHEDQGRPTHGQYGSIPRLPSFPTPRILCPNAGTAQGVHTLTLTRVPTCECTLPPARVSCSDRTVPVCAGMPRPGPRAVRGRSDGRDKHVLLRPAIPDPRLPGPAPL